ncbi:MAG: type II secretion system protein [Sedimentisphaerales bacterium]
MRRKLQYVRCHSRIYAFTLVELLVVIAIIALLLSILMPSLQTARAQAQRVVCLNNVKSQYLAQYMYATSNNGKFVTHIDYWPNYVRSGQPSNYIRKLFNGTYITNSKILLCPQQSSFGGAMADLKAYDRTSPGYGGWDAFGSGSHPDPGAVYTGYLWFANFQSIWAYTNTEFKFKSISGVDVSEPEWPKNVSACNATRAFITHEIVRYINVGGGNWWWDHGHGGSKDLIANVSLGLKGASKSKDNPVGYSDGHVEKTPRNSIKPRARIGGSEFYY